MKIVIPNQKAFFSLGLLLIALLLLPIYGVSYFNGITKCLSLATLVCLFGCTLLFQKKKIVPVHWIDVCWLGLIAWTGISSLWAVNEVYAQYGCFTSTLLYCCYKIFESTEWEEVAERWLLYTFLGVLLMAFALQFYILRGNWMMDVLSVRDDDFATSLGEVNHHWMGSLILGVLPFLLFRFGKKATITSLVFLGITYILTQASGSAQVMLGLILLTLGYIIYKAKFTLKQVTLGLVGLFVVGGLALLIMYYSRGRLRGIFFVIDEFYNQSDRLWMWTSSWQLFLEAPLTGVGKNNWELAIGEFGYNDCKYCSNDQFILHRFRHAHNAVIQTLTELGLTGFLFYLVIGVTAILGYIKQKTALSNLQLACLVSLFGYLFMSLMYGIVYNYYDHFQGLPVLAVFCLAILSQGSAARPLFKVNNGVFSSFFILLSFACLFYFYQYKKGYNNFQSANTARITGYNLGQAENKYTHAIKYWHPTKVYQKLGSLYQNLGYPELTLAAIQKAVVQDPNNLILRYDYANILYAQGYYEQALSEALQIFEKAEKYLPNKLFLVKCYAKTGQVDAAKAIGLPMQKDLDRFVNPEKYQHDSTGLIPVGLIIDQLYIDSIKRDKKVTLDTLNRKQKKAYEPSPQQKAKQYARTVINQNKKDKRAKILLDLNRVLEQLDNPINKEGKTELPQFLPLANIQDIPKLPNHTLFVIDAINEQAPLPASQSLKIKKEMDISIRGWAVDSYAQELAGGVFIEIAGELYRANYRQKRADVANVHGIKQYTNCGFSCAIPANKIGLENYEIKLWVLKNDDSVLFSPPNDQIIKVMVE